MSEPMTPRPQRRDLLTHWFSAFLRRRGRLRHFSRPHLPQASDVHAVAPPSGQILTLLAAAHCNAETALAGLDARSDGLDATEAARRLACDGPNEIAHEKPLSRARHLWACYRNPFNLLLSVLATLSVSSGDLRAAVVIAAMVVLSTLIRFVQERKSNEAADRLKALVGNTATVLRRRDGQPAQHAEIALREVVAGDVVVLAAGDMIPADCRLLSARDLFIAQSAMTGESMPVEKFAEPDTACTEALEQRNLLFMGTNVVSGAGTALVLATGNRSYFGTLARHVTAVEVDASSFQAGVNSVSWLLIRFAFVMVPLVLLINGVTKGDWLQAFLFALSVAVGLTPEMLPMIVTSTLAKGAVALARKKVVVKRLDAIQNFGAMDVLCTDKTGTLTQDRIVLARHVDAFGQASEEVLKFAFLNSHYQTGLKNLLDLAVLAHVQLPEELKLAQDYRKVDEIPFDFTRRRMSVVVSERDDHHELICKGALEEVLALCTRVRMPGSAQDGVVPLTGETVDHVQQVARKLNQEGLRVVAVAMKGLPLGQTRYGVADESELILIGYIAFLDPPKDSVAPALKALSAHGVTVKVLTGDNETVTACICAQVGLSSSIHLSGAQIEAMDDAALARAVEDCHVFAKLTPLHKERIVRALRARGHVVGFLGDGINDAAALRAADIGISVDTAVDIAKEAADIILLEKSLLVLDEGVIEGRTTFSNMLKYIRMTASSNFGNVFSVLVASAFLPFLPMLPLHLLLQNLLYDISQTGIPFDRVDAELVAKPLRWNPAGIGRFMLCFGPISSLFDIATFALLWFVFGANTPAQQGLFQSGWFVVGLLTQTLVVHMIRTPLLPFIQSRASAALMGTTLAVVAIGLWLPFSPMAPYLQLRTLPGAYFGWLLLIVLSYAALVQAVKRLYLRHFTWQ